MQNEIDIGRETERDGEGERDSDKDEARGSEGGRYRANANSLTPSRVMTFSLSFQIQVREIVEAGPDALSSGLVSGQACAALKGERGRGIQSEGQLFDAFPGDGVLPQVELDQRGIQLQRLSQRLATRL